MGGRFWKRSFWALGIGAIALVAGLASCQQQTAKNSDDDSAPATAASSGAASSGPDTVVEKLTPQIVGATLDALSIKYTVESDPRGFPMIVVDATPFPVKQFNILFFSCDKVEAECDDIALWAWYDMDNVSEKAIFAWNDPFQGRRWSTGYLDKDGDPALVMNINATGGLGERNLQILVNTFVEDMFAFHDLLKQQQTSSNEPAPAQQTPDQQSEATSFADVDGDVLDMTAMIKEYGGASFGHVKQADKKF